MSRDSRTCALEEDLVFLKKKCKLLNLSQRVLCSKAVASRKEHAREEGVLLHAQALLVDRMNLHAQNDNKLADLAASLAEERALSRRLLAEAREAQQVHMGVKKERQAVKEEISELEGQLAYYQEQLADLHDAPNQALSSAGVVDPFEEEDGDPSPFAGVDVTSEEVSEGNRLSWQARAVDDGSAPRVGGASLWAIVQEEAPDDDDDVFYRNSVLLRPEYAEYTAFRAGVVNTLARTCPPGPTANATRTEQEFALLMFDRKKQRRQAVEMLQSLERTYPPVPVVLEAMMIEGTGTTDDDGIVVQGESSATTSPRDKERRKTRVRVRRRRKKPRSDGAVSAEATPPASAPVRRSFIVQPLDSTIEVTLPEDALLDDDHQGSTEAVDLGSELSFDVTLTGPDSPFLLDPRRYDSHGDVVVASPHSKRKKLKSTQDPPIEREMVYRSVDLHLSEDGGPQMTREEHEDRMTALLTTLCVDAEPQRPRASPIKRKRRKHGGEQQRYWSPRRKPQQQRVVGPGSYNPFALEDTWTAGQKKRHSPWAAPLHNPDVPVKSPNKPQRTHDASDAKPSTHPRARGTPGPASSSPSNEPPPSFTGNPELWKRAPGRTSLVTMRSPGPAAYDLSAKPLKKHTGPEPFSVTSGRGSDFLVDPTVLSRVREVHGDERANQRPPKLIRKEAPNLPTRQQRRGAAAIRQQQSSSNHPAPQSITSSLQPSKQSSGPRHAPSSQTAPGRAPSSPRRAPSDHGAHRATEIASSSSIDIDLDDDDDDDDLLLVVDDDSEDDLLLMAERRHSGEASAMGRSPSNSSSIDIGLDELGTGDDAEHPVSLLSRDSAAHLGIVDDDDLGIVDDDDLGIVDDDDLGIVDDDDLGIVDDDDLGIVDDDDLGIVDDDDTSTRFVRTRRSGSASGSSDDVDSADIDAFLAEISGTSSDNDGATAPGHTRAPKTVSGTTTGDEDVSLSDLGINLSDMSDSS